MSKLPKANKFIDLSDYGRPPARAIARGLKNTGITPIHVTLVFILSGLAGIYCILIGNYVFAAFFLILKSILDAADGELARIKDTPSYTGRYLDSIADIVLNFLFLWAINSIADGQIIYMLLAFIGMQLQGTLFNYYYVILRNKHQGDTTSRIFEKERPMAMKGEKQANVNILFQLYRILYSGFDKAIYLLDSTAAKDKNIPNWLMTAVSCLGLGFQLLLISFMLIMGWKDYIIPFFIAYSVLIFVFIGIRKIISK